MTITAGPLPTRSGFQIRVRDAGLDDLEGVNALHARCSAATRRARYLASRTRLTLREWQRLTDPARGHCLLAFAPWAMGDPIGYATLSRTAEPGEREVAVLVEDLWQEVGVGTALVAHLTRLAVRDGAGTLVAYAGARNERAMRMFQRLGADVTVTQGEIRAHLPV
ncbi:GNAT family N-acetyltransferase [Catenuloplanes japonicus]|uniref:GNAT family N-acetyltransferase n=1 Tax=Catenuloplanes japonicus TaxID=33876 RepID=UPI00068929D1|nr:GNAT family N-acetyltransferase [Catenuloplanes japonicus]